MNCREVLEGQIKELEEMQTYARIISDKLAVAEAIRKLVETMHTVTLTDNEEPF